MAQVTHTFGGVVWKFDFNKKKKKKRKIRKIIRPFYHMLKSEDFHFLRVIKYGKTEINRIVYLVQHKGTKEYFALKKFLKPTPNESREKKEILFYVNNEIDINLLLYASDLSIPKLHGYWSTKEAYFLLYDFIEGMNLRDFLIEQKKKSSLPLHTKLDLFKQCVVVCQKLHQIQIFHADLTPENFLLTTLSETSSSPKIYLIDFEMSFYIYKKTSKREDFYFPFGHFMQSPESFVEAFYTKNRIERADGVYVWCLGHIFYLLMNMDFQYAFDQSFKLNSQKYQKFTKNIEQYQGKKIKHWIESYARLPLQLIFDQFPVSEYYVDFLAFYAFCLNDLLEQLLIYDPQNRIALSQICYHPVFLTTQELWALKENFHVRFQGKTEKERNSIFIPPISLLRIGPSSLPTSEKKEYPSIEKKKKKRKTTKSKSPWIVIILLFLNFVFPIQVRISNCIKKN